MNNFERQTRLEDAVDDMYGIKPQVYYSRINNSEYKVKLVYENKEVILGEVLKRGVTQEASLEYNGQKNIFDKYKTAEEEAIKILRG